MFEAQYLMTKDSSTGIVVFGPWFPRGGDNMRATIDILDAIGATITVAAYHKNRDDTGDGTSLATLFSAITAIGRSNAETKALKELVRYVYTVKASVSNTLGWVAFRMLAPVMFDTVSGT